MRYLFPLTILCFCYIIYNMKRQLNITIEEELINAAKQYAKQNYSSVSQLVRDYFLQLKRELERSEQLDSTETNSIKTR